MCITRRTQRHNLAKDFPKITEALHTKFQSMKSNKSSLKYQRFTPSGCKDKGIEKSYLVEKTHLLLELKIKVNFYFSLNFTSSF